MSTSELFTKDFWQRAFTQAVHAAAASALTPLATQQLGELNSVPWYAIVSAAVIGGVRIRTVQPRDSESPRHHASLAGAIEARRHHPGRMNQLPTTWLGVLAVLIVTVPAPSPEPQR
jgi:hypothetical protein